MEKLKLQYESLQQAYGTLNDALALFDNDSLFINPQIKHLCQDGLLQRFEYCYEVTWKYLKEYLRLLYGAEAASPKTVFQECWKQKIITETELELFINMVNDRNKTYHIYSEKQAKIIAGLIAQYAHLMQAVAARINPEQ